MSSMMDFKGKSKVKSVYERDGYLLVELEETIFYPGGGGQPCDRGSLKNVSFSGEVKEVFRENERILHRLRPLSGKLAPKEEVELEVNKERRLKLTKMHTGEHILFKSLERVIGNIRLNKIELEEDESSLFIESQKEITWKELFMAEELSNNIINEDRKITYKEYDKNEIEDLGNVRAKLDKIKGNKVRVVEIENFDLSACTGTHADSTGFVGNLLITKFTKEKGGYEIRFKTAAQKELLEYSRTAREAASLLGTDYRKVAQSIKRIMEEAKHYKKRFRELSYMLLDSYKKEDIKGIAFIWNVFEGIEKKQLVDKAAELLKEKTIICFITREGEKALVMLASSEDLAINIPSLLSKILARYGGKGGGKGNIAFGSIASNKSDSVIENIKFRINTLDISL